VTASTPSVRVVHVVPAVSQRFGGPSNVPGLVRSLASHGVDATLLTTDADPEGRLEVPLNERTVRDGVVYRFHHAWRVSGRYGLAPSMLADLHRRLAVCDLVHIHWLYNFSCIAAARAAVAAGVPFVVQPRGSLDPHMYRKNSFFKSLYLATVGRPLLTRAAAVVFTAEQERLLAHYSPRQPEWIVPNGLDMADYQDLPTRGSFRAEFREIDGPFLLFLGRLSRQKGLDLLLAAFKRIAAVRPNLRLVLAGPDHEGYEAHVRAMVRQLDLERRVLFTGMLTGRSKLAAFVDADLFVLPSYFENFGAVIIEALACGVPVLISDQVNIHRELSAAGVATVVACSVDSVAAGIESALDDVHVRRRMATAGPAVVRTHYSWEVIVPMLVDRYTRIIRRP
jgi:glycosyltransferase involved in cell wall biosynthesis